MLRGRLVFVDTHVLLHHLPLEQINWTNLVGSSNQVRLMLTLRVLEELDEKKYGKNAYLSDRARDVLQRLRLVIDRAGTQDVRPGVSIEFLPAPVRRRRLLDADQEILEPSRRLRSPR